MIKNKSKAQKVHGQSDSRRKSLFISRWWSEVLMLILAFTLVVQVVFFTREEAQAEPSFPIPGSITVAALSLRTEADPTANLITYMNGGETVVIVGEDRYGVPVNGNPIWYEVEYLGLRGWAAAEYIEFMDLPSLSNTSSSSQLAFYAEMQALGFPADYHADLYNLHLKFPNWKFSPLYTNYSFYTALDGQLAHPGLNLVPANGPNAHKSREPRDYSFATNTWKQYEYGWVAASREILAHVMDPRNFLNEREIFQFENLQFNPEVQTVEGVLKILDGTFMAGNQPYTYINQMGSLSISDRSYAQEFMQAADYANVNPYHLASRVRLEVSPKGSDSVSGDYRGLTGYYNFFNIGAYPKPGEGDSVYNGLLAARDGIDGITAAAYDRLMFPWTSPSRAIIGGANFLGHDYINADQQTLYLQKFNLVSRYFAPFQHQYMGNIFAPKLEAVGVYDAYREIGMLEEAKEFLIPVFTELPSSTSEPVQAGNPNNRLRSISINGEKLPGMGINSVRYTTDLISDSPMVEISAEAFDPAATVSGLGVYFLDEGENDLDIWVMASDGSAYRYQLRINYQSLASSQKANFELLTYGADSLNYLYGIDPAKGQQRPEVFVQGLKVGQNVDLTYQDKFGDATGVIGTGTQVKAYHSGQMIETYTAVIKGDVNGDGVIDITDAQQIARYLMGTTKLTQAELLAMDVNGDGSGDLLDAKQILNSVLRATPINQSIPRSN